MILKIAGAALIATIGYVLLKKDRADFALVLEICATAGLLIFIFPYLENLLAVFTNITDVVRVNFDFTEILTKICGISIVSRLICELCKDAGENALSVKFEFAAKVLILTAAAPIIKELFVILVTFAENLL